MSKRKSLPRIGSELYLPRFGGYCVVEASDDPSLVALRVPGGGIVRVGDKALRQLQLDVERSEGRRTL